MTIDIDTIQQRVGPQALGATQQAELESILRAGYRLTPATMAVRITNGRWKAARHLLHISTEVSTAIEAGNAFIIVTIPPRHGKSEFLSVHTPIWFLERWPMRNAVVTSYGADLATEFSLRVRDTFLNEELHQLLSTRLRKDKLKVDRFMTTQGGGMIAVGIGGTLTGRGAHLLLVDDYTKNAEDSLSKTKRDTAWNWFLSTAYTRLEPGGSVIVLATRWNVDDLIARILMSEIAQEMKIKIINLPAIAREGDPLGRAVGQPLWPERYPLEKLLQIKGLLGTYWWQALYQQDPLPSMSGADLGGCYKIIEREEVPHISRLKVLRAWDFAGGDEKRADWSVGMLMALDPETEIIYILDVRRFQKPPHSTEIEVQAAANADTYGIPIWIEQEPGSSGKTVIQHYISDVLPGYSVKGEKPTGPIEVRASPFLAAVEAKRVRMVRAPWNQAVIDETNGFPGGDNDDILTAAALAYNKLCRGRFGSVIWGSDSSRGSRATHIYTGDPHRKVVRGIVW